jgi:rare lipoprotein A (RlpA)-like double-psi beta-barrel protein
MQAGRDRHGRKDIPGRARTIGDRCRRSALRVVLLASIAMAAAVAPAQAGTGGASTVAYEDTSSLGSDIPFSAPRLAGATWYGPGFYGRETACGQILRPSTIGVAHRNLPCGTTVKFAYEGRYLITKVIDRGPYTKGNAWDLTNGARVALGFEGSGLVQYALTLRLARP